MANMPHSSPRMLEPGFFWALVKDRCDRTRTWYCCHPELTFSGNELWEAIPPLVTRQEVKSTETGPRKESWGWLADGSSWA